MSLAPGRDVVGRQDRFREGHLRHDDLTDLRRASDEPANHIRGRGSLTSASWVERETSRTSVDSVVARRAAQVGSDDVGQPFESGRYRPERFGLGARCRRSVLTDWMCWRVGGRGRPRWWVGRRAEWLGVAARRGVFDTVEAYRPGVGPAQPVLRFAVHVVRRRAVIAVVTMIEDAAAPTAHCARSSRSATATARCPAARCQSNRRGSPRCPGVHGRRKQA
jgi:hypothetical protein